MHARSDEQLSVADLPGTEFTDAEPATSVIAERLSRIVRRVQRTQAQLNAQSDGEWEWTANRLIGALVREGSMRLTALAAEAGCELSTVSRQVASLVSSGYVERHPDPADGRAFLLAATDLARTRYAEHVRMRDAEMARMLSQWSQHDLGQLADLLSRFNNALDRHQWHPPVRAISTDTEKDSI